MERYISGEAFWSFQPEIKLRILLALAGAFTAFAPSTFFKAEFVLNFTLPDLDSHLIINRELIEY